MPSCTSCIRRWVSLHSVVSSVVNAWESDIWFGAKLYPWVDSVASDCVVDPGVEVPVGMMNAGAVIAGIPAAASWLGGRTPMETGLYEALTWMRANVAPDLPQALVLVADGEISTQCVGETFAEALALVSDAWVQNRIATYVIGIGMADGSEADSQLTQLANAGGRPNTSGSETYYQTDDQMQLDQAMTDIIDDALSCVITIDPEPSEPPLFEVWLDGVQIPEVASCAGDGWMWTKDHSEITLCGTACADLKVTGQVDTKYFCTPG